MKLKQNQNRVAMSYSGNVNNKMENYKEGDLMLCAWYQELSQMITKVLQPCTEGILVGCLPSTVDSALDWCCPWTAFC